jgi:hypothetical protein
LRRFGSEVLLHDGVRILVLEGEHAATGVLDEQDLSRSEELLGDDD